MASSSKTVYECKVCGKTFSEWMGRCPTCSGFGTFVEKENSFVASESSGTKTGGAVRPTKKAMSINSLKSNPLDRIPTRIGELDRVLGGGFVAGEVVLFAGQPGAGKSTLCLSIAKSFSDDNKNVLYVSGEESEQQIGLRAKRMNVQSDVIKVVNERNLEILLGHIEDEKPSLVIVDSLQTLASDSISGSLGSLSQSKEAANVLTDIAKKMNIIMVVISQVVKSGDMAGSESIQHIVDCAMMLESDKDTPLKFLRASKNRFGDIAEIGVFQHTESGLEEVDDPSEIFLETNEDRVNGAACTFMSEGIRQIPVEIQALVAPSNLPQPRKQFNGIQYNRAQIVCAILDKFCKTRLFENDVFVSTVAGVKIMDPQADLAIAAAILSSKHNKPVPSHVVFMGELSLTGQIRGSFMIEQKIREAERLGFQTVVAPSSAKTKISSTKTNLKIVYVQSANELPDVISRESVM